MAAECLPVIVETKMESNVHACTVIPEGIGTKNLSAAPIAIDNRSGTGLAPCSMSYTIELCNSLHELCHSRFAHRPAWCRCICCCSFACNCRLQDIADKLGEMHPRLSSAVRS